MHGNYLVSIGIEECSQIDDVWMRDESHDLQFAVLWIFNTNLKKKDSV
jgi:hypothetical protein